MGYTKDVAIVSYDGVVLRRISDLVILGRVLVYTHYVQVSLQW